MSGERSGSGDNTEEKTKAREQSRFVIFADVCFLSGLRPHKVSRCVGIRGEVKDYNVGLELDSSIE